MKIWELQEKLAEIAERFDRDMRVVISSKGPESIDIEVHVGGRTECFDVDLIGNDGVDLAEVSACPEYGIVRFS